jgi:hypothetical protein
MVMESVSRQRVHAHVSKDMVLQPMLLYTVLQIAPQGLVQLVKRGPMFQFQALKPIN